MQMRSFVVLVFDENVTTFVYYRPALCSWVGNAVAEHGDYLEFNVKNKFNCRIINFVIFTKCELFVGLEPWSGRLTKRTIPGQRFSMFSIVLSSCMRPKCCQLNAWQRSEQFYTRDKLTQTSWIINFWWGVHGTSIDKLIYLYWYWYWLARGLGSWYWYWLKQGQNNQLLP